MDLKYFGFVLKNIRRELKFTQDYVSKNAYMCTKHLSRIENGKIYPSLEDLIHLSNLYKKNLIKIFSVYYKYCNEDVIDLINSIEFELIDFNYQKVENLLNQLEKFINNNQFIRQYFYFIKGILFLNFYKQKDNAFIFFIKSLSVFNNFNLNKYYEYNYSTLELRVLAALGLYFYYISDYDMYSKLLKFAYEKCDDICLSYFLISVHYAKFLKNQNKINDSLKIINLSLNYANEKRYQFILPTIYYIRSKIYEKNNNLELAEKDIKKSLELCKLFNRVNLYDFITKKIKLFSL